MRIQTINNQNNLSHRANLKNDVNGITKRLWAKTTKTDLLLSNIKKFTEICPQHEIEILESSKSKLEAGAIDYLIYNNTTGKSYIHTLTEKVWDKDATHLPLIISKLVEKFEKKDSFYKVDLEAKMFDKLTNKDSLAEI